VWTLAFEFDYTLKVRLRNLKFFTSTKKNCSFFFLFWLNTINVTYMTHKPTLLVFSRITHFWFVLSQVASHSNIQWTCRIMRTRDMIYLRISASEPVRNYQLPCSQAYYVARPHSTFRKGFGATYCGCTRNARAMWPISHSSALSNIKTRQRHWISLPVDFTFWYR
jgi:hypothetical protein